MSDEDKQDVVEIQPDKEGKYPETVPWKQYVGIKESLGKKLDSERTKVASLEEQLKKAASAEELSKTKKELEDTKAQAKKVEEELKTTKESSLAEKRATLVKRGVPEDEVKDMSDKELNILAKALGSVKPKPDLGGGGGSGELKGSPMELAVRAYSESSKK